MKKEEILLMIQEHIDDLNNLKFMIDKFEDKERLKLILEIFEKSLIFKSDDIEELKKVA